MKNEIQCPNCKKTIPIDESEFTAIAKQVRDQEFEKELTERKAEWERQKAHEIMLANSNAQSVKLTALAEKDREIMELRGRVQNADTRLELAVSKATAELERERDKLSSELERAGLERSNAENRLTARYKEVLCEKEQEIERLRNHKASLSTKLVGESLERHCEIEFDRIRTVFPNAYFGKDNDASDGSKGDYIYRETDPESGAEVVSIMFEMKNEEEQSVNRKKNEDFFRELDKDRKAKKCEYAVLVSLLERESELYSGITDVSHKFQKMYVIRPQFFISMITLLRSAALRSLHDKKELAAMKNQNFDIEAFEEKLIAFKSDIDGTYQRAQDRFADAVKGIDAAIINLQKMRENLVKSEDHFRIASKKADELTIRRLTHGNPTMKKRFAELCEGESGERGDDE